MYEERLAPRTGRLAGQAAIVTGAARGIGRAIALALAREGASVAVNYRTQAKAAEEVVRLILEMGGDAVPVQADVTDPAAAQALAAAAMSRWGRIDILVNNVGIGGGDGPAHRIEEAAFDRILEVNLKGAWLMTKAVLGSMREKKAGSIVNISSLASTAGGGQVAYEVSKAGVNRLTTSVAQSNGRYLVRCNAITPGLMDTPMAIEGIARASGRTAQEVRDERNPRVPLGGRMGTAWDTAYAALFLASDEARFITGAILPVDGGGGVRIG